jgi:hypothetical protein
MTETIGKQQSLKYFVSSPLQKNFWPLDVYLTGLFYVE